MQVSLKDRVTVLMMGKDFDYLLDVFVVLKKTGEKIAEVVIPEIAIFG